MFFWLLIARPVAAQARLLFETSAVIGFVVGTIAFSSVLGGGALLEEQSEAEPLRFQEAGWILGLPVGVLTALLVLAFRDQELAGSYFTLYVRPLVICVAFGAILWAVLTRLLLRREHLTRDDYACAIYMTRDQYAPLARRKQAWRLTRHVMGLTAEQAKAHLPDIVPALADKLHTTRRDPEARHVLELLGGLGEQSVGPVLLEALDEKRPANRRAAAIALGRLGRQDAVPKLLEIAGSDTQAMVRRAAVVALGKLKDRLALSTLLQALQDTDRLTRQSACVALGKLRAPEALPGLETCLKDGAPQVRQSAANAIERITGDAPEVEDEEGEK